MGKKRLIMSVINDLESDQRVHKMCMTLSHIGFEVTLVGRRFKNSKNLVRPYKTHRMRLILIKGPFFYAEYNIRLFIYLLLNKSEILVSNDLDTLPANYSIALLKGKELVYDSHEYFLGMPELEGRNIVKGIWRIFEKSILPKLKRIITVNESIANLYLNDYGIKPVVVRNISPAFNSSKIYSKKELGIPQNKTILILQGAGINIDRGAEELIESMQYIQNAHLYIIGSGDIFPFLPEYISKFNLSNKITILGRMDYNNLMQYTLNSDIGFSLDKPKNINYIFSLPNKVFDYIQANIAVIASGLTEVSKIVEGYNIGICLNEISPEIIAQEVNKLISEPEKLKRFKQNASEAAKILTWETESKKVREIYKDLL